jgi:uncharacterized repeat protein (TIGR01451 family)
VAQARVDVGDNADLIIFKSAPATVYAGATISYVLTVRNAGPSTAAAVQVEDALPLGIDASGCRRLHPERGAVGALPAHSGPDA